MSSPAKRAASSPPAPARSSMIPSSQALGVAGVQRHERAGEDGGLVAAGAGPDLDDHVLVVVRVAVDKLRPDRLRELLYLLLRLPRLGRVELPFLDVFGLWNELPRLPLGRDRVEQLLAHLGAAAHPRVLLGDLGVVALVAVDVRVGKFFS